MPPGARVGRTSGRPTRSGPDNRGVTDSANIDPASVDPDLLARWIAIASLIAGAEDLQARGGGPWPPLALVAADTANEAILGTIATSLDRPPEPLAVFDRVYQLANEALIDDGHPFDQLLRNRINELHRQRNLAVHVGGRASDAVVKRAIETARELREHAVSVLTLLEAFREAGPARAVGRLVGIEPVKTALAEAERLLAAGDLEAAADQCAIALGAALERARPGLRSYKTIPGLDPNRDRQLWFAVQRADETARLHEAWIVALGLGLRPVELERLQRVLGEPLPDAEGPVEVEHEERPELSESIVRWAVHLTTDVVFRLWQGQALAARPWPYLDDDEDEDGA